MGISLKPSEASSGGAVIDDVDVTIQSCRFRLWDYNGAIPAPILGLAVGFVDDDGNQAEQVYSAGETKHFVPSDDGSEAIKVGSIETLNDNTNAMAFLVSLVNAGFPEDKIADKVTVFEGTRVHVKQAPQPKRAGLKNQQPNQGNKTVLLVSQIHSFPWDAKPAGKTLGKPKAAGAGIGKPVVAAAAPVVAQGAAPAAAPAASAAPSQGGNGAAHDFTGDAIGLVLSILAAKGGSIPKAMIAQEAFKALATDPNRNAIVQLVYKDEFLKSGPWGFDGTTVSMGA